MRIKFNDDHRKVYGEKTAELANYTFGVFTLGQALAREKFSFLIALIGFVSSILLYILSYVILRGDKR